MKWNAALPNGTLAQGLAAALASAISLIVIGLGLSLPSRLGLPLFDEQGLAAALGLSLGLVFLTISASGRPRAGGRLPWFDALAGLLALGVGLYIAAFFPDITREFFRRRPETFTLGIILIPLIVEALRRTAGWGLVGIVCLFLGYALVADLVPGQLQGRVQPFPRLVSFLALDPVALLGLGLNIIVTVVLAFILLGALLQATGGATWFTDLAIALTGRARGGPAKIAVVASALMGTISGSAVSNVASTGVLTIPLMKRAGYSARSAAAYEAVASTGGQIMPPILGAAAFLMAEFLQVSYGTIVIASILPALLYYISVFLHADIEAARLKIAAIASEDARSPRQVLMQGWHFILPFAVLIIAMFRLNKTPQESALWACGAVIVVSALFGYRGLRLTPRRLWDAVVSTGRSSVDIIVIGAMAGLIIGVIETTGLGFGLTLVLVAFGEGNLFLLLLLTAVICIVLGMGMPTTAVYFLVATLAAPPLVRLGVPPLAAHMFVLYYGLLSMITPPVAIAAFTAANLAEARPMQTAITACLYGWPAFVVPFLFVLSPALLLEGNGWQVLQSTVTAIAGVWVASMGIGGYCRGPLNPVSRVLFTAGGFALLVPGHGFPGALWLELAGLVLSAALIGRAYWRAGAAPKP